MGLRVNTNVASITAQRSLATVTARLTGNYRRLATGLRIASAADDAAGLAISERLRAQVRSLEQAKRNASDGISMMQTAEGALNEVSSILIRLRELAIQSSNGSVSNQDKETLDQEFQNLVEEVDRIGRSTEFSGTRLLDGSAAGLNFQIGVGTTAGVDQLTVGLPVMMSTTLSLASLDIGSGGTTTTAIPGSALTRGGGFVPGDLDGDGVVNGGDLGALLSAWGACAGCAADLNGDGIVDGADLGLMLTAWTP